LGDFHECLSEHWRVVQRVGHICDLGSGLNYRKKGLQQLLALIVHRQVDVLLLNQ
jgi:predicted site-specific integrase-resolvase